MPADRKRRPSLLAVLLLVSLLLLTVDFRQGDTGPVAAVQRVTASVFAPVQERVAGIVRPVEGFFASIGQLGDLREENERLEEELARLREQQLLYADLAVENDRLRELVGMRDRLEMTTTAARVIAQPPGLFRWSVLIDAGLEQGVRENMAVVDADGLVGKVVEAAADHARVQLAASPDAGYAVRVDDTGQHGLLSGRAGNPMQLQIVDDPEVDVPAGAVVSTRWFEGTSIPDGIPIGVLAEAEAGQLDSARFLAVRPFVDFRRIDTVLVILDAPVAPVDAAPEEGEEDEEAPVPADTPTNGAEATEGGGGADGEDDGGGADGDGSP